ncbi:TnsA endonuclease N-terminal domain-containing protein [Aquitalea aquatilis]|uniref:TnsA endonuclease N-terminal domain-containing protein n=1 Tax=Aquitalea aquatilis TaxID=1537400 RepID=UPI0010BDAEDE|nr:TnsA endonuclease N-terminal domain-containing protein [Aquitalea aquatilis]
MLHPLHPTHKLTDQLLQQAEEAFSRQPDQAGVVHGLRRITQGARGRRTSLFPSRKNGITMALESQVEVSHCLLLEQDKQVIGYRCQPLEIPYAPGRCYYPDFLVRTHDWRWRVSEIKPDKRHLDAETLLCFETVNTLLAHCGFEFCLVDASDLPRGTHLDNLYWLYCRSAIRSWATQEIELAQQLLSNHPHPTTFGEAQSQFIREGLPSSLVEYLLFHGQLATSFDQPIRLNTPVWSMK